MGDTHISRHNAQYHTDCAAPMIGLSEDVSGFSGLKHGVFLVYGREEEPAQGRRVRIEKEPWRGVLLERSGGAPPASSSGSPRRVLDLPTTSTASSALGPHP